MYVSGRARVISNESYVNVDGPIFFKMQIHVRVMFDSVREFDFEQEMILFKKKKEFFPSDLVTCT